MLYDHNTGVPVEDNDLTPPLQSLILIQSLLVQSVESDMARTLVKRLAETVDMISVIVSRMSRESAASLSLHDAATAHLANLTQRQRQVLRMVLDGSPSKNIAIDLGISRRTVENHRASIMKKTGSKSLPALARLAQSAA